MRARPLLVILLLVTGFLLAAAGCGPRPLTEKEICGDAGCQACTGLQCTGTDGGP